MNDDFPPGLHAELLDDFYAECDEHLSNLRTRLMQLEATGAYADPAALESLYRSVHSLKGNAAIVGLTSAEQLAHALEGLLRRLSRGELPLTAERLDLTGRTGHRLEQIVATYRLGQPIPATDDLLQELKPFGVGPTAASVTSAPAPVVPVALPPGTVLWQATFSPRADLDARGVNIGMIRSRLAALGEILRAGPVIRPGGKMDFEFDVAVRAEPADLAAWEADGVVLAAAKPPEVARDVEGERAADAAEAAGLFIAPSRVVRVDLGRLDELMRIAGEMVIHRSRLQDRITKVSGDRSPLLEVNLALGRSLRELRETVTRIRMVPVAEVFSRLPFVVRDLGRDTGKQVRLRLEGQETEIDKFLVERLKEPLLHLVRNAVTHGIETPGERREAGKPVEATLLLRAATVADGVVIQVRDDGRGVDAARVAARASAMGLAVPSPLDEAGVLALLCTAGFSTQEQADRAAGRGVGMAVVASTLRELGGNLTLATAPGQWTQFTLRLPLTLSIAETFIVSAADQTCAVQQSFVSEIIQISAAEIQRVRQVEVVPYRDGLLPLVRLHGLFGDKPPVADRLPVLVISSERGFAGLVVDRVHGHREVVVRPIRDPLVHVRGVVGATELGDGKPVLILDATMLTAGVVRPHRAPDASAVPADAVAASR